MASQNAFRVGSYIVVWWLYNPLGLGDKFSVCKGWYINVWDYKIFIGLGCYIGVK